MIKIIDVCNFPTDVFFFESRDNNCFYLEGNKLTNNVVTFEIVKPFQRSYNSSSTECSQEEMYKIYDNILETIDNRSGLVDIIEKTGYIRIYDVEYNRFSNILCTENVYKEHIKRVYEYGAKNIYQIYK